MIEQLIKLIRRINCFRTEDISDCDWGRRLWEQEAFKSLKWVLLLFKVQGKKIWKIEKDFDEKFKKFRLSEDFNKIYLLRAPRNWSSNFQR